MTIRQALKDAGFTQSMLARETGINLRQIQRLCLEEARLSNITALNYLRICKALRADPKVFLSDVEGIDI